MFTYFAQPIFSTFEETREGESLSTSCEGRVCKTSARQLTYFYIVFNYGIINLQM